MKWVNINKQQRFKRHWIRSLFTASSYNEISTSLYISQIIHMIYNLTKVIFQLATTIFHIDPRRGLTTGLPHARAFCSQTLNVIYLHVKMFTLITIKLIINQHENHIILKKTKKPHKPCVPALSECIWACLRIFAHVWEFFSMKTHFCDQMSRLD